MTRFAVPLIAVALVMGGCGVREKLREEADSTRQNTEHLAESSKAANSAKQAKIYAAAAVMRKRQFDQELLASGRQERYEVRREGGAFAIYDRQTGSVAKTGSTAQVGLSESRAYAAYESLKQTDEAARSSLAALQAGRRSNN